jgi:hypothetical protein
MRIIRHTIYIILKDYHKFETDPATQLKYHRRMIIFWMLNLPFMNAIVLIDIMATLGHFPGKVALLLTAILLAINTNYSLYANWDTEVGDAHGAYASLRADQIQGGRQVDPVEDF